MGCRVSLELVSGSVSKPCRDIFATYGHYRSCYGAAGKKKRIKNGGGFWNIRIVKTCTWNCTGFIKM